MVCIPGEVKVNQHKLVCGHPERPRTWQIKMFCVKSNLYWSIWIFCRKLWGITFFVINIYLSTYLERFFLLGSSAKTPGRNLFSSHLITTRAPIYSCSSFGGVSKAMWWPDTRLFPLSSKLTLYFNCPSPASDKMQINETGKIPIVSCLASLWFQIHSRKEIHCSFYTYIIVSAYEECVATTFFAYKKNTWKWSKTVNNN